MANAIEVTVRDYREIVRDTAGDLKHLSRLLGTRAMEADDAGKTSARNRYLLDQLHVEQAIDRLHLIAVPVAQGEL